MNLQGTLFQSFDGSGRTPRNVQVQVLRWVEERMLEPRLAIQAPCGVGKAAIAKAIQQVTGAAIVTPNNLLLEQYRESYPDMNYLKGIAHYECKQHEVTCDEVRSARLKPCDGCPYKTCRSKAVSGEPTVYNPISMFYSGVKQRAVVVDEAHQLVGMIKLLTSQTFAKPTYSWPSSLEPKEMAAWLLSISNMHRTAAQLAFTNGKSKEGVKHAARSDRLKFTYDQITGGVPVVWYTEWRESRGKKVEVLVVEPVGTPRTLLDRLFGEATKIVLMSGTLPPSWAGEIFGTDKFAYLDVPSPIPKENRRVVVKPAGLTAGSNPEEIARWAEAQIKQYGGPAILHTTYKMGAQIAKFVPNALLHTPDTKLSTMQRFKQEGGLWIAAGCSEGVDLPGSQARLNLIPVLPFSDARSPAIVALKNMSGGVRRYKLETVVDFIQQVGRTTRSTDDWSVTVCGDQRIFGLVSELRKELPASFVESLTMERA